MVLNYGSWGWTSTYPQLQDLLININVQSNQSPEVGTRTALRPMFLMATKSSYVISESPEVFGGTERFRKASILSWTLMPLVGSLQIVQLVFSRDLKESAPFVLFIFQDPKLMNLLRFNTGPPWRSSFWIKVSRCRCKMSTACQASGAFLEFEL